MENLKWARKLSRPLVEEVLTLNPKEVEFEQSFAQGITWCRLLIKNDSNTYYGIAICGVYDRFDPIKGKTIALGRALAAFKSKISSRKVRSEWSEFPNSWSKRQIERVMRSGIWCKSSVEDWNS